MNLEIIEASFSVCRLSPESAVPAWAFLGTFYSVSKTNEELSIVCDSKHVPVNVKTEAGWSLVKVKGPLDFSLTGILASLANPLAQAGISIFAISTFETDYLMVKQENLQKTKVVLENSGFVFI